MLEELEASVMDELLELLLDWVSPPFPIIELMINPEATKMQITENITIRVVELILVFFGIFIVVENVCGGSGEIRTHEGLHPSGFQDRRHRPLGDTST